MTEAQGGALAGIGARLRGSRERRGLSLLQAAGDLHVDPAMLEALEADEFQKLGAAVFVRGHLRNYARLLGEAPEPLLALYSSSAAAAKTPDLTGMPRAIPMQTPRNTLLLPAGVALLVAVGVIGGYLWLHRLHATGSVPAASVPPALNGEKN